MNEINLKKREFLPSLVCNIDYTVAMSNDDQMSVCVCVCVCACVVSTVGQVLRPLTMEN